MNKMNIIIFLVFSSILSKETKRVFLNAKSEIHLVIQGEREQKLIGEIFDVMPSEVWVNGERRSDCEIRCNLVGNKSNIILKFEERINSCANFFFNLENIIAIDLSQFDFSLVENMDYMFHGCSNLEKIKFGHINTSNVKTMVHTFYRCSNLISLDLSNFDTSNVENMASLFCACSNLKYLDLSNFNTPKLTNIENMFMVCESLIYINMKKFQLIGTINKEKAFYLISSYVKYCLEDQDTKNLILSGQNVNCLDDCFKKDIKLDIETNQCINNCKTNSYEYEYNNICYHKCPSESYYIYCDTDECNENTKRCLDIQPEGYYLDLKEENYKKCFEKCKSCYGQGNETFNNCIECNSNFTFLNESKYETNCYEICDNYYYFDERDLYHCTESKECPVGFEKLIVDKNKCIDNCKNDDIYINEFNKTCYISCPNGTIADAINNICYFENFIPESTLSISSTSAFEFISHSAKVYNKENSNLSRIPKSEITLSINEIHSNPFIILNERLQSYQLSKSNISILEIQDVAIKYIQEIINNGFDTVEIDKGRDLNFSLGKINYTITSTLNQIQNKNNYTTSINLGKCEQKLKEKYKISKDESLYLLKIDTIIDSIPKIEYAVYYSLTNNNFTKLNLSICKNIKIDILIPVEIPSNEIDKHNSSSDLYNDICYTLTT